MIRKIELWNFECHKHTVLEDFNDGLNLIFGSSDSGKTSIVRALKLVAYNEFDPKSVRTGKKNCRVRVETDKGWVNVSRGKENVWETCWHGETPKTFEKIGKNILPEAAEILGLHMVSLGDMSLPVNIMDQGEGHFMLNELGGDNASGSMRAQIVDEISGLSGIEGLIKEVSLDRHRFGRAVKENEDRANELRETMHDKAELEEEDKLLTEAEELMAEKEKMEVSIEAMAVLFEEHHKAEEDASSIETKISKMPNTKVMKAILQKAGQAMEKRVSANQLISEHSLLVDEISDRERVLSEMVEVDAKVLSDCEQAVRSALRGEEMKAVWKSHEDLKKEVGEMEVRIDEMPKFSPEAVEECKQAIEKAEMVRSRAYELNDLLEEMDECQLKLDDCEKELAQAIQERNDALAAVDVCPLTGRGVSRECFKGMKFPVTEKKQ